MAGALGALAGSVAGATWRAFAAELVPDWQAALVEDAANTTLAVLASRWGRPGGAPTGTGRATGAEAVRWPART